MACRLLFRYGAAAVALSLSAARPDLAKAAGRVEGYATLPLKAPQLVIHKARHCLELREGGSLLKVFPVALGHRGLADKRRSGDHLTPEGRFYVCTRNERSRFHLFLGLSYPHEPAVRRGLAEGLLTRAQHDSVLRQLRRRDCPDWNTALGGAVGIHGGGIGAEWTWGCIALENEAIEELWLACPVGTPVEILP